VTVREGAAPGRRRCLKALAGLGAIGMAAPARAAEPGGIVEWPELTLLDGSTLAPASWLGRPAVVVFWATYCAYCRRHNAHLETLYRSPAAASLRILGVAMDADAQAVRRYMAANAFHFPVALDAGGLRARLTARRVIPMTCLIDAQGRLRQAIPGEMAVDDLLGLPVAMARWAAPEGPKAP
jgi:thiol-disulfide isomerase/thioredoxin